MAPTIDDEDIGRMIDIIGDGELTAEAQQRLHEEGLWPLYESLRQKAYEPSRWAVEISNQNSLGLATPPSGAHSGNQIE